MEGTVTFILIGVILAALLTLWLFAERWHLLRPSTRGFLRKAGLRQNINLTSLHAYVYGRWVKEYINLLINYIMPRLGPQGKKWWADRYHGKVLTPELAKKIITVDKEIPLRDLEQIIPYPLARHLVLKGPPDIAAFQCGCRQNRDNPCQPVEVCMVIGQPFVDFVLEHHPKTTRRLSQQEALELLQAEFERGHLHSAWFKDAMLDRFYAICNCCKCCCGGIQAMRKHGVPMVAPSGYVARVDEGLCEGCQTCEKTCAFGAIHVNGTAAVDWEICMGCGVCVGQCPKEALSLARDERKGVPLDVQFFAQEQARA